MAKATFASGASAYKFRRPDLCHVATSFLISLFSRRHPFAFLCKTKCSSQLIVLNFFDFTVLGSPNPRRIHTRWNRFVKQSKQIISLCFAFTFEVQGWRSGESTRLPPMWPVFDSQTRRHMWIEFVGSLLCTKRFSPDTPVSSPLKNQHLT